MEIIGQKVSGRDAILPELTHFRAGGVEQTEWCQGPRQKVCLGCKTTKKPVSRSVSKVSAGVNGRPSGKSGKRAAPARKLKEGIPGEVGGIPADIFNVNLELFQGTAISDKATKAAQAQDNHGL